MEAIILASSSPRRQEILKKLNIPFVVNPAGIEESVPPEVTGHNIPEFLASRKVAAVVKRFPANEDPRWVLGADTAIFLDGKMIGKPENQDEARVFLSMLSGKTHDVVTGLALYNGSIHDMTSRTSVNSVTFAKMSDKEIDWYLGTGEWHGAAGAYRIQGLASCFITKIEGTESSVMGLPIFELYDMLKEQNYSLI